MTFLLIVALVAASAYATKRFGLLRAPSTPRDQVDAFTRARSVTNTWSADPQATPAPLKEFLASQHKPRPSTEDPSEEPEDGATGPR